VLELHRALHILQQITQLVLVVVEYVQMLQITIRIYLATEVVTHFSLEVLATGMALAAAQELVLTELPDKILAVLVEPVDLVVLV